MRFGDAEHTIPLPYRKLARIVLVRSKRPGWGWHWLATIQSMRGKISEGGGN